MAQVNELLRRELATALAREYEAPVGCFVTIEEVITSNDLSHARIAISVLPIERGKEIVKELRGLRVDLHRALQRRVVMKTLPKLEFVLDDREERADRINRLLDSQG